MVDALVQWCRKPANLVSLALVLVSAAVILSVSVTSDNATRPAVPSNLCTQEDGNDQEFCWWYDQGTGWIMNIDHGRYTYVPKTGDMINYDTP